VKILHTHHLFKKKESSNDIHQRGIMRVVVIGGGIAGAAISRSLSKRGASITLLERSSALCSGATWHAAGLVTRFAGSPKLKKLHVRSLELLEELHGRTEDGIGLHLPGSIRLIEKGNDARLAEAMQHVQMAALYDLPEYPTEIISPEKIKELHPLIDTSSIECGIWTPNDGDICPSLLTHAVSKEARAHGASVLLNTEVVSLERLATGGFKVHAVDRVSGDKSIFECDAAVNAAGLWSRGVTDMMDSDALHHPAFVIEHQYAVTEAVEGVDSKASSTLPVLRDLAGSSYIRQEQRGFLIGPYESECTVRSEKEWARGPPPSWDGMELFQDSVDRLEDNLMSAMTLIPALETVGFKSVVNGPTIWTGDSLPRCGRSSIPGWYDFNSLTYGIAQGLPLAEYLTGIILDGEMPFDGTDYFDPLRYGGWASDAFAEEKIKETYTHNNSVVFGSYENRSAGVEHLGDTFPLKQTLASHGALFGTVGHSGTETPLVYAADAKSVRDNKTLSGYSWAKRADEEALAVVENVGISYCPFSKIVVSGPRADELVGYATTAVLPKAENQCRLTYALTPTGKVQAEFSMVRTTSASPLMKRLGVSGNAWYMVGSRDHSAMDAELLRQRARELGMTLGSDIHIVDASNRVCVLQVAGPKSADVMRSIQSGIDELKPMRTRSYDAFGDEREKPLPVEAFRVSFTGEAGFELHVPSSDSIDLHELIWSHEASKRAGLVHFGSAATNSLRIERGYKVRADLDYVHYTEADIAPYVSKKRNFLGKGTTSSDSPKTSVSFKVAVTDPAWEWSIVSDTPIRDATKCGRVVGYTTTSAKGTRTGGVVALGYLTEAISSDSKLEMESWGKRWNVEVSNGPVHASSKPKAKAKSAHNAPSPRSYYEGIFHSSMPSTKIKEIFADEATYSYTRKPIERAWTMNPMAYYDDDFFDLEQNRIYSGAWTVVGLSDSVRKPGDTVLAKLGSQNIFLTRDKNMNLNGFLNVCRHRGSTLVHKDGNYPVISCPYHRWGYALDGRLLATPLWDMGDGKRKPCKKLNKPVRNMSLPRTPTQEDITRAASDVSAAEKQAETSKPPKEMKSLAEAYDVAQASDFKKKDYPLFNVRTEEWNGFLFATKEPNAPSVKECFGDLDDRLSQYPLDELVQVRSKVYEPDANWKLLAENFMEYYHLPSVHPELCKVSGVDEHERRQGPGQYVGFCTFPLTLGGTPIDPRPDIIPAMPGLDADNQRTGWFHYLFPNMFWFLFPDHMFAVYFEPQSATKTVERGSLLVHPTLLEKEVLADGSMVQDRLDDMFAFYDMTNMEDILACERVQNGIKAHPYEGGRYSFRFEETIHRFQNMVIDHVIGQPRIPCGDDVGQGLRRDTQHPGEVSWRSMQ
jgi:glycine/D-amino acid oxidase-like deaminating enzyme/phenylpropionate dioxygenase-like ring-hydroxylating dioxygenase large terminal subunit/glycine cleavage system aminomethyltransferase T